MFCQSCRESISEDHKFCPTCGKPVLTEEEGVNEKNLFAFVGKNVAYYKGWWELTSRPESQVGWNWVAFFLTPFWLGYRKMYKWLIIFQALMIGLTLFDYLMSFTPGATAGSLIDSLASLAIVILSALFGNALYYRFAQKKISEMVLEKESDDLLIELGHKGGTSARGVWLALGLDVVSFVIYYFATR